MDKKHYRLKLLISMVAIAILAFCVSCQAPTEKPPETPVETATQMAPEEPTPTVEATVQPAETETPAATTEETPVETAPVTAPPEAKGKMKVTSPTGIQGVEFMPFMHTSAGENTNPNFEFNNLHKNAKSLAIVAEDSDVPGGFTHWLIFNIKPDTSSLPIRLEKTSEPLPGVTQATNDFGKVGYLGPNPPPGKPHTYVFKFYALNTKLKLKPSAKRADFDNAIKGKVIDEAMISVKYIAPAKKKK